MNRYVRKRYSEILTVPLWVETSVAGKTPSGVISAVARNLLIAASEEEEQYDSRPVATLVFTFSKVVLNAYCSYRIVG